MFINGIGSGGVDVRNVINHSNAVHKYQKINVALDNSTSITQAIQDIVDVTGDFRANIESNAASIVAQSKINTCCTIGQCAAVSHNNVNGGVAKVGVDLGGGGVLSAFKSMIARNIGKIYKSGNVAKRMEHDEEGEENFVKIAASINDAETALSQLIAVRNKLVDAFNKIINIPL